MTDPERALVLLVDDCNESRQMYADVLLASFEIAQASTGAEALAKASEQRPTVIVLDLMLPDMGGEDVIRSLKRDARTEHIPIVIVSGHTEPRRKPRPWNAYLVKPCHPDALHACLDRVIKTHAERVSAALVSRSSSNSV